MPSSGQHRLDNANATEKNDGVRHGDIIKTVVKLFTEGKITEDQFIEYHKSSTESAKNQGKAKAMGMTGTNVRALETKAEAQRKIDNLP